MPFRILFIFTVYDYDNPFKPIQERDKIQFGISYISSLLKSKGYTTSLIVIGRDLNTLIINKKISEFKPQLICFTAVSKEYYFVSQIARYIKNKFPSIYLLIGGAHASLNPEAVIKDSFDALCIGEGEYPTLELVEQLKSQKIPSKILNLWIKKEKIIEKNVTREFIQDLDRLPLPDREIWEAWIFKKNSPHVIILGRGCPYECTYCCNHVFRKLSNGKYVRFRSVENVIKELEFLRKKYPDSEDIYFEVETIGASMKYALKFAEELQKYNNSLFKPFNFGVNLRIIPNVDFEPLFHALMKANFKFINIGIESGSNYIRTHVLKRFYSNSDIYHIFQLAKKYQLKISTFNLIGLPGETLKEFRKTLKINRLCQPDWLALSIFNPYPGTELYKQCLEENLFNKKIDIHKIERMERRRSVLTLNTFSQRKIRREYEWFQFNIYRNYYPTLKLLKKVIYAKIHSRSKIDKLYQRMKCTYLFPKIKSYLMKVI